MKKRQEFIDLAIELSSGYEIDMNITEYRYRVEADIYVDDASCSGHIKLLAAKLITMCDKISHFANQKVKEFDLTISLDYYTHAHFISGRRMDGLWGKDEYNNVDESYLYYLTGRQRAVWTL